MFYKSLTITMLFACNLALHAAQENSFRLATTPYSKEAALSDMRRTGYEVEAKDLVFKGDPNSGANFVDAIVPHRNRVTGAMVITRVICYGPGRYVNFHTHRENEDFEVTDGSCTIHVVQTNEDQESYVVSILKTAGQSIHIPAETIHALQAGEDGLCMHISRDDSTRGFTMIENIQQPWGK